MKNIGIVTLNGYFNYGNRLQNYALQETLISLGYNVETIRFTRDKKNNKYKLYLREIKKILTNPSIYLIEKKRYKNFVDFSRKYINETEQIFYVDTDLTKLNCNFDYFVVGSDQVWNPMMNKVYSFFFLDFSDKNKRIAYAPSFGVSKLPDCVSSYYQKWIKNIPYLSVREDDGAKIIKSLSGREVDVLVDPTVLLTKEKWIKIAKASNNKPSKSYLLTYFLGGISSKYKEQINKIAQINRLKIIDLGDINKSDFYKIGPSEFIDYINDCSVFFTDSFHGVVFSILLQKPFIACERKSAISMYSRIDTLLNKFDLNERKWDAIQIVNNVFDIDFSHTLPLLNKERDKAISFLNSALNVDNGK